MEVLGLVESPTEGRIDLDDLATLYTLSEIGPFQHLSCLRAVNVLAWLGAWAELCPWTHIGPVSVCHRLSPLLSLLCPSVGAVTAHKRKENLVLVFPTIITDAPPIKSAFVSKQTVPWTHPRTVLAAMLATGIALILALGKRQMG